MTDLKNKKQVNWFSWQAQYISSLCNFYIETGWCKNYEDDLIKYEEFLQAVTMVDDNRKYVLHRIINKSRGLREFLMIHSVFDIKSNAKGDWLVKFLIDELYPTDEDVKKAHEKELVPYWVLEKLSIFDPRLIGFEGKLDNIEIRYKMYGNWNKGESSDPIIINNRAWENTGKQLTNKELEKFISSYKTITV